MSASSPATLRSPGKTKTLRFQRGWKDTKLRSYPPNKGFIIKECIGKIGPDASGNSPNIDASVENFPKLK